MEQLEIGIIKRKIKYRSSLRKYTFTELNLYHQTFLVMASYFIIVTVGVIFNQIN